MVCRKCGKINKDTAMFCIQCGSPLESRGQSMYRSDAEYRAVPPKKSKKGLIIGITIAIVIVLILLVVSGIIIYKKGFVGNKADENTEASTEAMTTTQELPTTQATTQVPVPSTTQAPVAPTTQAPAPPTTQAPPANTGQSNDFVIPYSGSTLLSESDLVNLSKEKLRIARNEIYARHGRKFKDEALQAYFMNKSWYQPLIDPDDFDANEDAYLSQVEKKNKDTIYLYEKKKGYIN